jgi:hypothetical protein
MARLQLSGKRLQIDKANSTVVIFVSVAAFVLVFSLVASKALLSQRSYQSRVIKEKTKALDQLKANNEAAAKLATSYKSFVSEPTNIIGGSSSGSGDRDGDNAQIVLDSLPSKYDFPALVTSLEKILSGQGYKLDNITGSDDELNQAKTTEVKPIEIPFQVSATGNFDSLQSMVDVLYRSIRPIYINKMDITGTDNDMSISITSKTYYQPEKTVSITTKEVK